MTETIIDAAEPISEETDTAERTPGERIATLEQGVEGLAQAMVMMAEGFAQLSQAVEALEGDEAEEPAEDQGGESGTYLNALRDEAYGNAVDKGFHANTPEVSMLGWLADDAMKLALIHAEVSEALEALRDDHLPDDHVYLDEDGDLVYDESVNEDGDLRKPEGVPAELADVIIRVLDYCGSRQIDIARAVREKMAYNATRPAMHGKQF